MNKEAENKIVEFEIDGVPVLIEASFPNEDARSGFIASDKGESVVKATSTLEKSLEPVMSFAGTFMRKIETVKINKPAMVELQFGIKFGGGVNFWIVSGQGEGTINLKLTWNTKPCD